MIEVKYLSCLIVGSKSGFLSSRYRDGHLDYDLTTFGLKEESLRKKFDFYRDHFLVSRESVKESGRSKEHDEL